MRTKRYNLRQNLRKSVRSVRLSTLEDLRKFRANWENGRIKILETFFVGFTKEFNKVIRNFE